MQTVPRPMEPLMYWDLNSFLVVQMWDNLESLLAFIEMDTVVLENKTWVGTRYVSKCRMNFYAFHNKLGMI